MALIFVTGNSGAGKSTVREELSRRGARAYDTDEDEIAQWTDKVTGEVTPLVTNAHRTPEFLARNDWKADSERVRQLAEEGEGGPVFLCGSIGNEDEVWPFFEKVFLLSIDEPTMRHRLLTRTAHDFGTKPHELDMLLAWNEAIDEHYLRRGAIRIDATRAPRVVVDEILHALDAPT
jgi:broad-specificity NMP kinase